jgi:hypothetical protein
MLQESSAYFRGCLSNSFTEALTNEITLADVHAETFALFVDWLANPSATMSALRPDHCMNLWLLGDRLLCDGIQDDSLSQLRSLHSITPGTTFGPEFRIPEEAKTGYLLQITQREETAGSALQKLYVELVAKAMRDPSTAALLLEDPAWSQLEKDVVNEVMSAMTRQSGQPSAANVTYLERTFLIPRDEAVAALRENNDDPTKALADWRRKRGIFSFRWWSSANARGNRILILLVISSYARLCWSWLATAAVKMEIEEAPL